MKKHDGHPGAINPRTINRLLSVKVHPGASRNEVTGFVGGALHVKIAAPPEKGKANKELTDFLAGVLDIKKSEISIVKGETGRDKLIYVEGLNPDDITRRLTP